MLYDWAYSILSARRLNCPLGDALQIGHRAQQPWTCEQVVVDRFVTFAAWIALIETHMDLDEWAWRIREDRFLSQDFARLLTVQAQEKALIGALFTMISYSFDAMVDDGAQILWNILLNLNLLTFWPTWFHMQVCQHHTFSSPWRWESQSNQAVRIHLSAVMPMWQACGVYQRMCRWHPRKMQMVVC